MSQKNTLANKQLRRAEREDHAARMAKKRSLQARMLELVTEPPETPEAESAE